jgi:hypothetical protein
VREEQSLLKLKILVLLRIVDGAGHKRIYQHRQLDLIHSALSFAGQKTILFPLQQTTIIQQQQALPKQADHYSSARTTSPAGDAHLALCASTCQSLIAFLLARVHTRDEPESQPGTDSWVQRRRTDAPLACRLL